MKQIIFIIILFLFIGCSGYKPSSHYVSQEIGTKVFVNMEINIDNAENSTLIKDAMNEMLVSKLNSELVSNKNEADTVMNVILKSVSISKLQYSNTGYVEIYRVGVTIEVKYKINKITRKISVSDYYDFSVDTDAIISDSKKHEAIKIAALKALSEIFINESFSEIHPKTLALQLDNSNIETSFLKIEKTVDSLNEKLKVVSIL